jgi:TetR/AcrR family acrAB operon transcriptional repressor
MSRKPARAKIDTLKTLEEQAFGLFGRYGYEGVSIGDIAKAAKLSKGALYWHFQGKEELYLDCLKRLHQIFEHYIFGPMRKEANPVKAILMVFSGLRQLLQDPRVEKGLAGYWLIPSSPETSNLIEAQREFEAGAVAALRDALQRGKDQGMVDFGDDNDLDQMAGGLIALVEACVLPLRHMEQEEVQGILGMLARTLFRAYAKSDEALALARSL